MKSFVLMLIGSICLGSSAFLLNYYLFVTPNPIEKEVNQLAPSVKVLCLATDAKLGEFLTEEKLTRCSLGRNMTIQNYYTEDQFKNSNIDNFVFVRSGVKGDLLVRDLFLKPEERGYLGFLLGKSERAKTVVINNLDDFITILHLGDPVDLLLTHKTENSLRNGDEYRATSLVENVKVIGIDGNYDQNVAKLSSSVSNRSGQLTLALSARQATRVAVAEQIGIISVLLRAPEVEARPSNFLPNDLVVTESDLVPHKVKVTGMLSQENPYIIRILKGNKITFLERPGPSISEKRAIIK